MGFRHICAAAAVGLLALGSVDHVFAQESEPPALPPTAAEILSLIETHGTLYFADAAADLDAAKARLSGAWSGLLPSVDVEWEGERYESTVSSVEDKIDFIGSVEVVQPIFDFGRTSSLIRAAEADKEASDTAYRGARNLVLLEGLATFFDLHSSDIRLQNLNEEHASAYVRWERAKEREELGQRSSIDVAEWLAKVEKSRWVLHREKTRNTTLRLRLTELTARDFPEEMINPPKGPTGKPKTVSFEALVKFAEANNSDIAKLRKQADAARLRREGTGYFPRLEAYGTVNHFSRSRSTRDEWNVGGRVVWPLFDGGTKLAERARLAAEQSRLEARFERSRRELVRRLRAAIMAQGNAWQQLIAARAGFEFATKYLFQRQRLYEQDRVADLGRAMIRFTDSEAELVRAAGSFYLESARIAAIIGVSVERGLEDDFLSKVLGEDATETPDSYVPKGGSGFGQEDQKKLNRKAE